MKIVSLKCPECKADISLDDEKEFGFCQYCGTKILLQNENEFIYKNIDEAKIKQAETERLIKIKQMEIDEKTKNIKIKVSIAIGFFILIFAVIMIICRNIGLILPALIGVIVLFYMWTDKEERKELASKGMEFVCKTVKQESKNQEKTISDTKMPTVSTIKIPKSVWEHYSSNYAVIEAELREAGFTNIKTVPLCDLKFGLFNKPGEIEKITFGGKAMEDSFKRKYPKNISIIISYHSFEKR